ncbi:hypothetical protein D3C87_938080 [compost metagenome]
MGKNAVIVLFNRSLAILGAAHHPLADEPVDDAEANQNETEAHVHGHGGRHKQHQRDESGQMRAHEFEPEAKQRFAGAQQRVEGVRRAALMVPGERHRDDAPKGFRQQRSAPAMGQPVGLAGDRDISDGVEDAKTRPQNEDGRDIGARRDGVNDPAEQYGLGDGDRCKNDVGNDDHRHTPFMNGQIAQSACINLKQGQIFNPVRASFQAVYCSASTPCYFSKVA